MSISRSRKKVRALVVDDSSLARRVLSDVLNSDPDIAVVGLAQHGLEAVRMVRQLRPDLVTMDVDMPLLDGYGAVREIMARYPVPILVLAEQSLKQRGLVARMLAAGALEVMDKPSATSQAAFEEQCLHFLERAKLLASIRLPGRQAGRPNSAASPARPARRVVDVVAIVASTGGPAALSALLAHLPADFGAPILVVQHIAAGFVDDLARWLDLGSPLSVRVACGGDRLLPGLVLLAPDERHLEVHFGRAALTSAPPELSLRPSGNRLLHSVAREYGPRAVGVILTGMGYDGAAGLAALRQAGGLGIAQNEASSSIFGMPRAAVEAGGVDEILPLQTIASYLARLVPPVPLASGNV